MVQRDPDYARREAILADLKERRPVSSAHIRLLGTLSNRDTFVQPVDFESLAPSQRSGHERRDLVSGNYEIGFSFDPAAMHAVYQVPPQLIQFAEAITLVAQHEHGLYADAQHSGSILKFSVDQRPVLPGQAQRASIGSHVAHRDWVPTTWAHNYMVANRYPTEFFPFDRTAAASLTNYEAYCASQPICIDDEFTPTPVTSEPFEVAYANNTAYHRSPVMTEGGARTFLRMSYHHDVPVK